MVGRPSQWVERPSRWVRRSSRWAGISREINLLSQSGWKALSEAGSGLEALPVAREWYDGPFGGTGVIGRCSRWVVSPSLWIERPSRWIEKPSMLD